MLLFLRNGRFVHATAIHKLLTRNEAECGYLLPIKSQTAQKAIFQQTQYPLSPIFDSREGEVVDC